ncbi:hypothetical protein DNAM_150 [Pseudomonas phage BroderSalsa]|nr:hypothetical protein DNAM_150 [Pseudomonas phage BroderSalsa]
MDNLIKSIGPSLVISAVVALFGFFMNANTQTKLLEQNIQTTHALSEAVTELRLQLGITKEKYVTRDELNTRLKEFKRDGS